MGTVRCLCLLAVFLLSGSCTQESGSVPEVPADELTAAVPELERVHDFMQPLWHDAFPQRDFEAIQALVPQFEPTLAALDSAQLPGILRDKTESWNQGKADLMSSFQDLKTAAAAGDEEGMLGSAEAFHRSYEGLVRLIRPVVPAMDAFHQHLYGLYHYYGPGYDMEKIWGAAQAMAETVPDLLEAELPSRVQDRQERFRELAVALGDQVDSLLAALEDPTREEVEVAIEEVHSAYAAMEALFN